jgi:hypothetical protein
MAVLGYHVQVIDEKLLDEPDRCLYHLSTYVKAHITYASAWAAAIAAATALVGPDTEAVTNNHGGYLYGAAKHKKHIITLAEAAEEDLADYHEGCMSGGAYVRIWIRDRVGHKARSEVYIRPIIAE